MNRNLKVAEATGGWFWAGKSAMDKIGMYADSDPKTIALVYMALARLSSDNGNSESFTAPVGTIAKLSFCSRRAVQNAFKELVRMHLLKVQENKSGKINAANTYTMLAGRETISHFAPVHGNTPISCAPLKEIKRKRAAKQANFASAEIAGGDSSDSKSVCGSESDADNSQQPVPIPGYWDIINCADPIPWFALYEAETDPDRRKAWRKAITDVKGNGHRLPPGVQWPKGVL